MGVLGCILLDPRSCLPDAASRLGPAAGEAFYDLRHQLLYRCLDQMQSNGIPIDLVTLNDQLKSKDLLAQVGGLSYIATLPDKVPSAANLPSYLDILLDCFTRRRLISVCTSLVVDAFDSQTSGQDLVARAQDEVIRVLDREDHPVSFSGPELAERLRERIEARMNLNGARSGLVTGFNRLDDLTDGLQAGEQFIIGARPSEGKTALACNLIDRVCLRDGHRTAFVTLEMSAGAICNRLLSGWTEDSWPGIPMRRLRRGTLDRREMNMLARFHTLLRRAPLHLVDGARGMGIRQVCSQLRALHRRAPLKLVLVDYLQKIRPASRQEKRTYEVAEVSGELHSLSVELDVAFVTLAQLSREPERDKGRMPRVSDLADCAQIERDADEIGLIHLDKDDRSKAMLLLSKQRDGEIGPVPLSFNGVYCRFENPPPTADSKTHTPALL